MSYQQTDLLDLAAQFVNNTASHIFLTGKAGTGKTTFLRDLALKTHKSFVIVAPTGIAALNAQGVTIHSQFLLPFGSFVPDRNFQYTKDQAGGFYSQRSLAGRHPLNKERKQVLRAADLVIIDEVSMLRADILDAIDYRMRSAKGNFNRSFGGAQVLMIGDLFQLPPIVKDHEWGVLKNYYRSMHFFEALALKQDGMVYIELDKIFRQEDDDFIRILNNLRDNAATPDDIDELNKHFKENIDLDEDGVITITTHNYKAKAINEQKMAELPGPASYFDAEIEDDFPENMYPLPERIELKVGAQVMFVKNDTTDEKAYYNGKLARVDYIDDEGVTVIMADDKRPFLLRKEKWENKKYTVDENSKDVSEDVVGRFYQFPVKPAWAVTVHKSQGLTFDKAVIDVGQAFAPGQVYVALSRLRSLDGLIMRTRIHQGAISSDHGVVHFAQSQNNKEALPQILKQSQRYYLQRLLATTFDFSPIDRQLGFFKKDEASSMEFEDETMRSAIQQIQLKLDSEKVNTEKFKNQLLYLVHQGELETMFERLEKGSAYYKAFMADVLKMVLTHYAEVERFSRTKKYLDALSEVEQFVAKAQQEIEKVHHIAKSIVTGERMERHETAQLARAKKREDLLASIRKNVKDDARFSALSKSGKKRKGKPSIKREKGETYKTTWSLVKEGMDLKEIAEGRGLALSTIEGHVVKGIRAGELEAKMVMPDKQVAEIKTAFIDGKSLGAAFNFFNKKFSYDKLRMVQAEMERDES